MTVDILYTFLSYRLIGSNDDIVEARIMKLARLNASVANVLTCLDQRKRRGGHR